MTEANRMQTRRMETEDRGLVENVLGAVLAQDGRELTPDLVQEIRAQPEGYRAAGGEVWVQEANGALIGTAALRVTSGRAGTVHEIRWIAMVPAWRGMGIGRLLAETAIQHARDHQARAVLVRVPDGESPAHALFESMGFVRAKPSSGEPEKATASPDIPLLYVFPASGASAASAPTG